MQIKNCNTITYTIYELVIHNISGPEPNREIDFGNIWKSGSVKIEGKGKKDIPNWILSSGMKIIPKIMILI